MADTTLFQLTIEAGANLVRELDAHGIPPETAAWYFDPDREEWRFMLQFDASREKHATVLATVGLINAHDDIFDALSIGDITVVAPTDPLAVAVRSAVHTRADVTQKPFGPSYTNGFYIPRGLTYRAIDPQAQPAQ